MRAAKTPLTGDKIDAPAACAVPFRPYCGGVATRTQNVSEYMRVLALCLVIIVKAKFHYAICSQAGPKLATDLQELEFGLLYLFPDKRDSAILDRLRHAKKHLHHFLCQMKNSARLLYRTV